MKKTLLANSTPDETRVALLEDGKLVELFIDRHLQGNAKLVGNIYKGRVENVLPGISSAFVDVGLEKNAYLYITDVVSPDDERDIAKMLTKNTNIMIQVAKEAIGTKGMKVTMDVSLPGRYLVYMPLSKHIGISRQIEQRVERDRLRTIVQSFNPSGGVIVRTEAQGIEERSLRREMKYLLRLWENVHKKHESTNAPALVHKELGLTFQIARDILTEHVEAFLLDSKSEYEDVKNFVEMLAPELVDRVRFYDSKTPIFDAFHVEEEISKLRQARIDLPSGGYIVVQEAESLCAIDVNTGKFTGRSSQEETVTVTNIEAAVEVARQLRLRHIGGIIVIDFIDMKKRKNRIKVTEALQNATHNDHAKIKILPITRLGLIEMTRERKHESLLSLLCEPCEECQGSGWVLSKESLYLKLRKEIMSITQGRADGHLKVYLNPEVSNYFKTNQARLERHLHRSVEIQPDLALPWENYKIVLE